MASPGKIPISDARRIGQERLCPVVVIFGIEESCDRFTVTTWGRNRELCAWAAKIGEDIHEAVMEGSVCGDVEHAENPYEELKRLREAVGELEELVSETESERNERGRRITRAINVLKNPESVDKISDALYCLESG